MGDVVNTSTQEIHSFQRGNDFYPTKSECVCYVHDRGLFPGRDRAYFFATTLRRLYRPTLPPFQWIPRALAVKERHQRLKLITHNLVGLSGLGMSGASPQNPHPSSWNYDNYISFLLKLLFGLCHIDLISKVTGGGWGNGSSFFIFCSSKVSDWVRAVALTT